MNISNAISDVVVINDETNNAVITNNAPLIENIIINDLNNNLIKEKIIRKKTINIKNNDTQMRVLQNTYKYFSSNNIDIRKFTIPELKIIAKYNGIPVSGTKHILADRIETAFRNSTYAIKIQRVFTGFLVRQSIRLRGKGLKDRKSCVNETDFYTMDPLVEIPFYDFFSYTDNKNFTYGYSIKSLIELLKKKGRLVNPYNREKFGIATTNMFMRLLNIDDILYRSNVSTSIATTSIATTSIATTSIATNSVINPPSNNINILNNINVHNNINAQFSPRIQQPINPQMIQNINNINTTHNVHISSVREQLGEIRQKPLAQRMTDLFMEIDQLGNYTNALWFSQLSTIEYINFYVSLVDIWRFRAQLSSVVRFQISPLQDPFHGLLPSRIVYNQVSLEQIQTACVNASEILVYTGLDVEQRKLGAIYVLSALTVVSMEARNTMPWLYEAFYP